MVKEHNYSVLVTFSLLYIFHFHYGILAPPSHILQSHIHSPSLKAQLLLQCVHIHTMPHIYVYVYVETITDRAKENSSGKKYWNTKHLPASTGADPGL